jgi:hypothetical protein
MKSWGKSREMLRTVTTWTSAQGLAADLVGSV